VGLHNRGALMPKKHPTEVYEIRISLQDREKEMADQFLTAWSFNRIATPLVEVLKDVTAIAALLTLLAALIGFVFVADEDLSVANLIDLFFSQRDQAIAAGIISVSAPGGIGIGMLISQFLGLFGEES